MLRSLLVVLALLSAAWSLTLALSGGIDTTIAGWHVSSNNPTHPLTLALIATLAYVAVAGPRTLRRDIGLLRAHLTPFRVAALLALGVGVLGVARNSWSAGGSDSYSYVSQMDLWLRGDLKVPVPLARTAPWPDALRTFAPLGYRTVPGALAIAPVTASGLPLLMALFKLTGGHAAGFLVVPITGALLVWVTFLIGRRIASSGLALGAAWVVATSPTFLMLFRSQMSDVPAAAFWALALYGVCGSTSRDVILGGLAASMAILVRPNLVPLAALLFAWLAFQAWRRSSLEPRLPFSFALAVLPGCLAVAAVNTWLFGSPLQSGYGDLSGLFSVGNVGPSTARYARWLAETQTPLPLAGIVVLLIAPSAIWPTAPARASARLCGAFTLGVWALYSVYPAFDAWWFLRFLLPAWPALAIGTTALLLWAFSPLGRWRDPATAAALIAVGTFGVYVSLQRGVFVADEGERRYATIAGLVEQHTEPDAMILSAMHAGPVRYYAGRATLRYDELDEAWLDRTVAWLDAQHRHPYLLIEDWELPAFTKRFAAQNRLGALPLSPALVYRAYAIPGSVYLYDLLRRDGATLEPPPQRDPRPRCVPPGPPPLL